MLDLESRAARENGSRPRGGERNASRGLWASVGAVVAAFGAALCCVGPIVFVTFGVGAGLASTFEPLRPVFTVLAVLGLGVGFVAVYGRGRRAQATDADCGPDEACTIPRSRARDKVILWTATVLAIVFWSFSYWSLLLV